MTHLRSGAILAALLMAIALGFAVEGIAHVPRPDGVMLPGDVPPVVDDDFTVYPCAPPADVVDSRAVGRGGGWLTAGRHRLRVPPDAVQGSARLTLREHAGDYLVVTLHPPGLSFRRPVEISLSTYRCGTQEQPPAGVIRFTPRTGWLRVDPARLTVRPGSADGEYEVLVSSDGFSSYALIAP
jgi:hypothetical protein